MGPLKRLLVGLLALLALAGCASGPLSPMARADDGGPVYISPGILDASAQRARIQNQLTPGDGIVVHVLLNEDLPIPESTITISWAAGAHVSVVADDGWMNQVVADDLLDRVKNIAVNPWDQITMLIRSVHAWQDKNPRPVPPTPPGPPVSYTWLWWLAGGMALAMFCGIVIPWRIRVKKRQYGDLASRADDPNYWKGVMEDLNKKVGE